MKCQPDHAHITMANSLIACLAAYPTFPWSWLIHTAKENPLSPIVGTRDAGTVMEELSNLSAVPVVLPGLPSAVVTPTPKLPSVARERGAGEEAPNGHVLLQISSIQLGDSDAVASAVYLQKFSVVTPPQTAEAVIGR